jgi:hypothetical protein
MDEFRAGGPDFLGVGYYVFAWAEVVFPLRAIIGGGTTQIVIVSLMLLVFYFVIPLLPAAVVYLLLRTTTSFRLSAAALSARLWRVVAGVFLLVALNYLSLWIEQQPWALNWSR